MNVIIPRNTQIPDEKIKAYSTKEDKQRMLTIEIYEGEHRMVIENNLLGSFSLTDLPDGSRLIKRIFIKFDIDADGIWTVSANVHRCSATHTIEIHHFNGFKNFFHFSIP